MAAVVWMAMPEFSQKDSVPACIQEADYAGVGHHHGLVRTMIGTSL